jgi:hypothetical protein
MAANLRRNADQRAGVPRIALLVDAQVTTILRELGGSVVAKVVYKESRQKGVNGRGVDFRLEIAGQCVRLRRAGAITWTPKIDRSVQKSRRSSGFSSGCRPLRPGRGLCAGNCLLSPLDPAHHHFNQPAPAPPTDEPLAPSENGGPGAVPSSHIGGVGST